jgi:hypothetical protein
MVNTKAVWNINWCACASACASREGGGMREEAGKRIARVGSVMRNVKQHI